MAAIEWDDFFSVNNAEIDAQHRKWIGIYNEMDDRLLNGDRQSLKTLGEESLQAMEDYARSHFGFEEEFMHRINYPDIVAHRRLHKDFENRIYQYNREVREGKIIFNSTIIGIIRNWLIDHILKEDKKYCQYATRLAEKP